MIRIVLATRNRHKVRELKRLLAVRGIRWQSLEQFPGVRPARETAATFDGNAIKKAAAVARQTGRLALADDSGLEVDSLGGAPGVRSARFAGPRGDDRANNEQLLRRLGGVPARRRGARYRCSLALADPSGAVVLTRGTWRGRIGTVPAGRQGFGYDPLFIVPGFGRTVGQLSPAVKGRLSHRAAAARRMRRVLERLLGGAARARPAAASRAKERAVASAAPGG